MRDVHKTSPLLHMKALAGDADEPGTFEAIVSVFGNEDSDGEAVQKGAFVETLAEGNAPITYSHQWMDPPIGKTLEAEELDRPALLRLAPDGVPDGVQGGLYAKGKLHVDGDYPMERAKAAYRNLMEGSLSQFSWSGSAPDIRLEKREGRQPLVWIEKVDLAEWGPCLRGANRLTALLGVKAQGIGLEDVTALKASVDRLYEQVAAGRAPAPPELPEAPSGGNSGLLLLALAGCPTQPAA